MGSHGADDGARELAQAQRTETAKRDAPLELRRRRPRGGGHHVLPVAPIEGRSREVPQRDGPAHSHAGIPELERGQQSRLGARGEARTAILLDWESWWALELDSKPSTAIRMLGGVYSVYKPLYEANVPVDFAHPGSDLSSYRLVIAPNLYLVTDDSVDNILRYVSDGGTLLMSFFSGIVDGRDHI